MRVFRCVGLVGALLACNVEGPDHDAGRRAEPVAPEPADVVDTRDEPPPAQVDLALGDGLEMRRPIHDGRLTLIPIVATAKARLASDPRYITLAEGMTQKLVSVTEVDDEEWDVDWVRVTNRSPMPLAIIEGELIIDGKQDRVIAEDIVIAANTTRDVAARCVEEKRKEGDIRFHDGGAIAELSLRRTVIYESQESIWARVDVINARNKLRPHTRTYRHSAALLSKGDAAARRAKLLGKLGELEERNQMVGVAVAIDGELVAIDRLATPELYRAFEGRLLASYLPTTAGAPSASSTIAPDTVRAFAKRRAQTTPASTTVVRAPR